MIYIFNDEGGELRVRLFGVAGTSVPSVVFCQGKASVPGISFGAARAFGAMGVYVLGESFGGWHADKSTYYIY